MNVLIQPHVSEKAATVTEKANQYVFRVRDDASKAEVKQRGRAHVRGQGRGRQSAQQAGQDAPLQERGRQAQRLQEGLRALGRPGSRSTSPAQRSKESKAMALIKMKPTSPGTRFVVKIDRSHLHKGGPLESLTDEEEPHRRAQSFRPADHAPHRRRPQAALPHRRFQARQGRHSGRRRAARIRSEPHRRTSRWCCTRTASAATSSRRRA